MKCPACSVENDQPKRFGYTPTTIDKLQLFDERSILYCESCGFGMIEKDVDPDVLQTYYSSDYSGKAKKQIDTKVSDNRTKYSFDVRSLSQLALIRQYVDIHSRPTIVEIGAGTGDFLFSLRQAKFNGRYIAFEPQEQSFQCLQGLGGEVERQVFTYQGAIKYKDSVDLVVMSHSLEHFNPGEIGGILNAIQTMLRKDGIFFCEVPNANLDLYPNAGERVVPHLSFFSIDSLRNFLDGSGMKVVFLNACGNEQLKKDTNQKIQDLDKKGYFIFDLDHENNILRNRRYHQDMELKRRQLRKRQFFLNVCFKILGKKVTRSLMDFIKRCRQNPYSSLIGDNHFSYSSSREFIRLVARK